MHCRVSHAVQSHSHCSCWLDHVRRASHCGPTQAGGQPTFFGHFNIGCYIKKRKAEYWHIVAPAQGS